MKQNLRKRLFYFPAFSAGPISAQMKKNCYTPNNKLSFRYYSQEYPEEYRVPAYLTTAGHLYKQENYIKPFDFPSDCVIFGDSGGFQIATGKLTYSDSLRDQIFEWLENNSTIAANLDIPPKIKKASEFDECLDLSYKNFKYFEKKQTGKVKFLNILQGVSEKNLSTWYEKVRGLNFNGWAVGIDQRTASLYQLLASVTILMEGNEHFNEQNEWLHFLGVTGNEEIVYLTQIQKSLQDIGSNIQISTDSSSPNITAKFGGYFTPRTWDYQVLHIPRDISKKGGIIDYKHNKIFPPVTNKIGKILRDEYINTDVFIDFKSEAYAVMVLQNLSVFSDCMNYIHEIVYNDSYIQEQIFDKTIFSNIKLIDRIIKAENPRSEFKKLLPYIKTKVVQNNNTKKHNFF